MNKINRKYIKFVQMKFPIFYFRLKYKTWSGIGRMVRSNPKPKNPLRFPKGNCRPTAAIRDYEFCDRNR